MPNPVGTVLDILKDDIVKLTTNWKAIIANVAKSEVWSTVVSFLLAALDDFIKSLEDVNAPGADKKATVLASLSIVYDDVVPGLLPIYLRPFNPLIKSFLFNTLIPVAIDFIVAKYHGGQWSGPVVPTPPITSAN